MGSAGLAMMVLAWTLASTLSGIFVGYDVELFEMTKHAFQLFSFLSFWRAVTFYLLIFTALNNGGVSAAISFLRTLVFRMLSIWILPGFLGLDGIWWAITVAEVLAFMVSVIFLSANRKKYRYL